MEQMQHGTECVNVGLGDANHPVALARRLFKQVKEWVCRVAVQARERRLAMLPRHENHRITLRQEVLGRRRTTGTSGKIVQVAHTVSSNSHIALKRSSGAAALVSEQTKRTVTNTTRRPSSLCLATN